MAMCVLSVNLKAIFRHLDATLPKFQLRCGPPAGAAGVAAGPAQLACQHHCPAATGKLCTAASLPLAAGTTAATLP